MFFYLIFINFFSNILSINFLNIIPNNVSLGSNQIFEFNVSNLATVDVEFKFELKDKFNNKIFELECFNKSNELLECKEIQILIYEHTQILSNPELNLFNNNEKTNLTLLIIKPEALKLIKNYNENNNIFNYAMAKFELVVNYNKLYNSNYIFKIGDENIYDCIINDDNVNLLVCEHEIITTKNNLTLKLIDDEDVKISYKIKEPNENFSLIKNMLKSTYFINQNEQNVYFIVDSSYKMNESEIYLKNSNEKILLSKCSFFNFGFDYAKCNAILKNVDNYDVYVNNSNTNIKISVLEKPKIISSVENIKPNKILISNEETKFILNVDYVVDLNNTILTLENEFFSDEEKIFLNCAEIEENSNEIECSCKFSNSGVYYVYLNGIKQKVKIVVYNNNLTKGLKIEPEIIKIESKKENITIIFDSIKNIYNSKLYLKSDDNITLNLTLNYRCCYLYAYFDVVFSIEKTYFLYINDIKQEFISIFATKNNFTSKIVEIFPKSIATFFKGIFTLKVDNNTGISSLTIYLKKDDEIINLKCKENLLNWDFAECEFSDDFKENSYKIYLNEIEQENLIVNSIFMPELNYFFPIRIFPSLNKQNVSLFFSDDVQNFTNKINFVSDEFNLSSNCVENDDFFINCSAEFKNEGEYFIYVNDVNYGKFIFVNKEENFVEINENFSFFVKNCFLFLILIIIL